jgi:hypothetical protein
MNITMKDRIRRSEPMTKDEHKAFTKWVQSFPTQLDAAAVLGVSRITISNLVFKGTGHPDTIKKVREVINRKAA